MKNKISIIFFLTGTFYTMSTAQSLQAKIYGLSNTTIQEKTVDVNPSVSLRGFDPKYGYQLGVLYQQPIFRSFALNGEIGFLNKGHNALDVATKQKLYEVNYNYLYVKPSASYEWHGLSLSVGMFFNFLLNQKGLTIGTISKTDIAYSYELSYRYKRVGLSVNTNESLRPMQKITLTGDTYEHYHRWYAIGLSYQIYKKKPNESSEK